MANKKRPWNLKPEFPRMIRQQWEWTPEDVDVFALKMARDMTEAAIYKAGLGNVDIINWTRGYLDGILSVMGWQGKLDQFKEIQDMIDWLGENESLLTKR